MSLPQTFSSGILISPDLGILTSRNSAARHPASPSVRRAMNCRTPANLSVFSHHQETGCGTWQGRSGQGDRSLSHCKSILEKPHLTHEIPAFLVRCLRLVLQWQELTPWPPPPGDRTVKRCKARAITSCGSRISAGDVRHTLIILRNRYKGQPGQAF